MMKNLKKLKVLLLENIHPSAAEVFAEAGIEKVTNFSYAPSEAELLELIPNYHVIGIRSRTQLTAKALAAAQNFSAIGCFCIGTNQVDLQKAKLMGIPVFNAPYSNTRSVAEMTISLAIGLFRQLFDHNASTHQGVWNKSAKGAHEVRGKKLGIVGYGHIGKQLSTLAEGLGMQVYYYDIYSQLSLGNARSVHSLAELLSSCDLISLHVPETPQTQWMIGQKELAAMKKGSFLINLSRGTVVDIEALAESLGSGHLGGAALDVYPTEPATNEEKFHSPLQGLRNVVLTPHIGGSTEEAQVSIGREVAQKLLNFLTTATTLGSVNFAQFSMPILEDRNRFIHIHQNTPGMLALVNKVFSTYKVNILGQFLQTDADLGFALVDCSALEEKLRNQIKNDLRAIPGTIRAYPIY